MLSKKILSLGLTALLSASLLVGCGSTEVKTESSKSEQPKQEQKAVFDEVIADNKYIKMTLVGKKKNEYGAIALKVLVENKTDNRLLVSTENLQVNGVMNDPYWSCTVNAKAQAYNFIEWYVDSDLNTNVKTVDDLKNINGDLQIAVAIPGTDNEYETEFRTQISILSDGTTSNVHSTDNKKEVVAEKPSSDKTDSTPKDTNQNETKSTQKKSNENTTKEEPRNKHKCWLCEKNITNENFGGYSEDGTMICYKCLNKYGKDEPEEPKEEPVYDEYGYDQYGNYDPNKDLYNDREWNDDDYERWDDIHGDEEEDYDDYSEEPIQEADDVE